MMTMQKQGTSMNSCELHEKIKDHKQVHIQVTSIF